MTTLFEHREDRPATICPYRPANYLTITTDRIETNRWYVRDIIVNKHSIVDYNNFVTCHYRHVKNDCILVYSKTYGAVFTFSVEDNMSIVAYNTDLYIVINNIPTYLIYGQGYFNITNQDIIYDQTFESPLACIIKYRLAIYDPKRVGYGCHIYPQKKLPHIALPLFYSLSFSAFKDAIIH